VVLEGIGGKAWAGEGLNRDVVLITPNEVEINDKRQVVSSWKGMYFIRPSEKGRLGQSLPGGPGKSKNINFFSVSIGLSSASQAARAPQGRQCGESEAGK
jgi:hypothetical protein